MRRRQRILVYDDVFTGGHTLDAVTWAPRTKGRAKDVCGVALARQPYRRH